MMDMHVMGMHMMDMHVMDMQNMDMHVMDMHMSEVADGRGQKRLQQMEETWGSFETME